MADIRQINVGGTTYDIKDAGATRTTVIPNDNGEIKTKYRMAKKDYTGAATTYWYYEICKLPKNDNNNYASAIISGRIGGWESGNMSYISALVWNRGNPGLAVIDIGASTAAASSIWSICDLVLYTNSDGTATLYAKCANYFAFDLDLEVFQSSASITYTGNKLTSVSGTLNKAASSTKSRMELINGELYVEGTKMSKSTHTHGYSGTTGANSGTAVTAVTGVGANGTATALTGVKVSNSSSAAPGGHTHSVTASGTVTLTDGTAPSMNFNTGVSTDNAYISALAYDGYTPAGSVTLTAGTAPSMGAATIKYLHLGAGTTPVESASISHNSVNSGANSGSGVSVVTGVAGGSGSLTSNDTASGGIAYIASHTKASLGTASTSSAAPGGHTHSFTPAGTIELASSENSDSGYLKYAHSIAGGSYSLGGTKTFVTGVSGGSGSLVSYTTSSGSTVQVSNGTRIPYITGTLSGTTLTLNTYYLSHAHSPASSSGTGTVSLSGSAPYLIYRYIKPTFTGTSSTSGANSGTNFNAVTGYPSFSGGGGTTKYLHHTHTGASASGTSTVAPNAHTHSYDRANSTVSITRGTAPSLTADTTATGGIQYVHAQGTFSAGTTPKSSASFAGTKSTAVVTGGTTRRMKFNAGTTPKAGASFAGTAATSSANSGTNFDAATAVGSNGTATVLTGVKASGTANCAPAGHTHGYSGSTN